MDIVKIITPHTNSLREGVKSCSVEQRKDLIITLLNFYFLLPDFENTINYHIKINIKKDDLISKIKNNELEIYREANRKSLEKLDEYNEDYEETETIENIVLDGFSYLISDVENPDNIVCLFTGIIDTLDYYENFSDDPKFWNNLLEIEVDFQKKLLIKLQATKEINTNIYQERYKDVIFDKI